MIYSNNVEVLKMDTERSAQTYFSFYAGFVKPVFDFCIAAVALLLLLPFIFILTLILMIANGGKPFFFQARAGKNERIFQVMKFKTMSDKKDENGDLLSDAERLTWIGRFVRKTSLDELPQLINVLKGDMSLVGPRPFLADYLPLYSNEQRRRFGVKPGITGWAQINGRNAITWTKKLEYDVWYANNISLALDFKIMIRTISKIFKTGDVNQSGEITAERFNGYN